MKLRFNFGTLALVYQKLNNNDEGIAIRRMANLTTAIMLMINAGMLDENGGSLSAPIETLKTIRKL